MRGAVRRMVLELFFGRRSVALVLLGFVVAMLAAETVLAQVEPPDRRYLFTEDRQVKKNEKKEKERQRRKRKQIEKARKKQDQPFDIHATNIQYDSSGKIIRGDGGLILSYSNVVLEAEKGEINVETKEAELQGDVRMSDPTGTISADVARLQLEKGTGQMKNADIFFEDGSYQLKGREVKKLEGQVFELEDAKLTTCDCPDAEDCSPWTLDAGSAKIERNGYGQVWNTVVRAYDVPVMYVPYLFFPVKTDRQSGLLPINIGSGKESGFNLTVPFFWAIDNSTDATITGILETQTRYGVEAEFRKIFSTNHRLYAGGVYLNESPRDGDLQGTVVDGIDDPTLKENRFGGYLEYNNRTSVSDVVPFQMVLDGHYVNDDLFIREFENDNIAEYNARFVTSRGVVRTSFLDEFSAEAAVEYNQAMVEDDDQVLQRLPELTLGGLHTFRPFGTNPLGLKLVLTDDISWVNFSRQENYDGSRGQIRESLRLPFHFRNYFEGSLSSGIRATQYSLNETRVDGSDEELPSSSDRVVPDFAGNVGTIFERVFDAREDNIFKTALELGKVGRREELVRLKHTIEPTLRYRFVPFVDQDENPQFDSEDRLPRRNVVGYQLTQRLISRFEPRADSSLGVEESAPRVEDLGELRSTSPIDEAFEFGTNEELIPDFQDLRRGSKREVLTFKLSQSFDIDEYRKDWNPDREAYSDVGADLRFNVNEYVRFEGRSTFAAQDQDFTSYSVGTQLLDKRGDQLRTRLNFIDGQVRQLEAGGEAKVVDRVKVGYYARYDDRESEFIEQRVGARLYSSCNCWIFNVDLVDRINPDETKLNFSLTLIGLGEVGNSVFADFLRKKSDTATAVAP